MFTYLFLFFFAHSKAVKYICQHVVNFVAQFKCGNDDERIWSPPGQKQTFSITGKHERHRSNTCMWSGFGCVFFGVSCFPSRLTVLPALFWRSVPTWLSSVELPQVSSPVSPIFMSSSLFLPACWSVLAWTLVHLLLSVLFIGSGSGLVLNCPLGRAFCWTLIKDAGFDFSHLLSDLELTTSYYFTG